MRTVALTILVASIAASSYAQLPANDLYQYNEMSVSPAFAGIDGQKVSFMGNVLILEDDDYRITKGFVSFESYIPSINTGVGVSAMTVHSGNYTDVYTNLLGNYQLKLNGESKLVFGLKVTGNQKTVYLNQFDPGDPVLTRFPTTTASEVRGGASVLYKRNKFFAAFSGDNLMRMQVSGLTFNTSTVDYKEFSLLSGVDFKISRRLKSISSLFLWTGLDYRRIDLNSSLMVNDLFIAGISVEANSRESFLPKVNGGLSIKDKARILLVLYSSPGELERKFNAQTMVQVRL